MIDLQTAAKYQNHSEMFTHCTFKRVSLMPGSRSNHKLRNICLLMTWTSIGKQRKISKLSSIIQSTVRAWDINLRTRTVLGGWWKIPKSIFIAESYHYIFLFCRYSVMFWLTLRFLDGASAVSCQDKLFQIWHHIQHLLFTVLWHRFSDLLWYS